MTTFGVKSSVVSAQTDFRGQTSGSELPLADFTSAGVRRLDGNRHFTFWTPDMTPARTVRSGEIVLVEMNHGLPDTVTRDGSFRKPGAGD